MHIRSAWVATLALAVAMPVSGQESFTVSGSRVAVYNLAGHVQVVAGTGNDVTVRMTRGGDDGAQLRVETDDIRGRNTLRVIYPSDQVVYSAPGRGNWSTTVRVRDDGTFGDGGDRVRVRGSGRGLDAHADLVIAVPPGHDVAVYVAAGEAEAEGIRSDLLLDLGSGRASARGITGALRVDTGSGSVEVADIQGELSVDTGSGSVTLDRVSGPRVSVDTGSGGVEGGSISTDRLVVDTGSGGIRLRDVTAPDVELDTGSGSVTTDLHGSVERLIVDTGSGSVTVSLPDDINAEVDLDSGSGGIDLDFAVEVTTMRRDKIEGRIGNGRGLIKIDTGSGSIRLRRN